MYPRDTLKGNILSAFAYIARRSGGLYSGPFLPRAVRMNNWTIQNRILFLALLPGVVVALVLGAFFMHERASDLNNLLDERAMAMVRQLAPTCEYGVMTGNTGILQNIANSMLEEKDVRAVSIFNQDMATLAHAGPRMQTARQQQELLAGQLQLQRTDSTLRIRTPIYAQNLIIDDQPDSFFLRTEQPQQLLGWAELELSLNNTRLLRYQHIASSMTVILLALLTCSFIAVRASRQITRPLKQVVLAMKDLEDGKLDTRVHLQTGGEFRQLASGINAMASALQRANSEHQHNIEQTTRDLQETLDELEIRNRELTIGRKEALEASRMKSEFLANVSHEIRTPLNGIIGFSELLARTQVNERQADYLATMRKSSSDLLKIINDILDLSKIDAGKLIIEHTGFNLRDVLEDVLTVLAPEATNKGLELNYLIYSDVPLHIQSDPLRLKQVLTNLINNAIKFTERGSVSVRVSVVSRNDNRAGIRFEIQDTGIGMTDVQIGKIFTAFSQADASTARKFGGTGLGLIIARALVEAMHGEIRVQSQPGRGSTFSFHIEAGLQQNPVQELPPMAGFRVAVLEPSLLNRMNIGGLLSQWQIEHDDCENRPQLLELFERHTTPQWQALIIATGRQLPDDDNLRLFLQEVRKLAIPIIALTDNVRSDHLEALKQLGASYSLSQPFTHRNLYRVLRQALQLAPLPGSEHAHSGSTNQQQTPRILAVDDNAANLKLVVTLLQELQLPVLSATSGQEAIDIVQQHNVDMVLMDIQMPGMNGLEATSHIRALPERGNMPIIALTAHAMADEKEALLKAGMNDYQTKPISQEQLISCVERWTGYRCQAPMIDADIGTAAVASAPMCHWVFDAAAALRHANNKPDLAADMFRMLLDSLALDMPRIMDAWEEDDMHTLLEQVHRVHGATRYCGVPCLRGALEKLETALKAGQTPLLPDLLRQLVEDSATLQHWSHSNDWEYLLQQEHQSISG